MFPEAPLLAGIALALSLAAPPGPANALIAQATARRGFTAGWLTGLGAVTGDLTMLTLTSLGTLRLLALLPWLKIVMASVGALLMTRFAYDAWRAARKPAVADTSARGGFVRSYVLVMTSPFNFAWWLTAGAALIGETGASGIAGFFIGLLIWITAWSGLALAGTRRIARFAQGVGYASAGVLGIFAVILVVFAVRAVTGA